MPFEMDPRDLGDEGFKTILRGAGGRGGGIGRGGSSLGSFGRGGSGVGVAGIGFGGTDPLRAGLRKLQNPMPMIRPAGGRGVSVPTEGAGTASQMLPSRLPGRMAVGSAGESTLTAGTPAAAVPNRAASTARGRGIGGLQGLLDDARRQAQEATNASMPNTQEGWWDRAAGNQDDGWAGWLWRMLADGGHAGAFDPAGSPEIARLIGDTYNTRGAMEDAGDVNELSALGLDDPSLYGAMLMSKRANRGLTRDANIASARTDSANSVQDMMRGVFGDYLTSNNAALTERLNRASQPSGNSQAWGQIAGSLIPMLFGGG